VLLAATDRVEFEPEETVVDKVADDEEAGAGAAELLDDGAAKVVEESEDELLELGDVDEVAPDDVEDGADEDTEGQVASGWIKLELSVIDAPRANTPPSIEDSASIVIETAARMFPIKSVPIPTVALVPTFQKTLPEAPPVISTDDPTPVVRVLPT
jgi:hypothetical protein